jgi:hypothetical protein
MLQVAAAEHTCGVMAINGAREIREIEVAVE